MKQAQLMRLMRLHLAFAVLALVHHAPRLCAAAVVIPIPNDIVKNKMRPA
jgi:hypothetical protein